MNAGEMLDQLTVTAKQVNEETGDIIPGEFRIKNPTAFADQFKEHAKGGHTKGYPLAWGKTEESFVCRPGEVTIVHGLSSSGKTAWLSHNTLYWLQMCKVMVASLEMMPVLQLQRLYAQKYGSPDIEHAHGVWGIHKSLVDKWETNDFIQSVLEKGSFIFGKYKYSLNDVVHSINVGEFDLESDITSKENPAGWIKYSTKWNSSDGFYSLT